MLIFETVKVALLPALSVAMPLTDWPAPSPSVVEPETLSRPESASLPLKLTATSALYQLLTLAERSGEPLIDGAVLSMLTLLMLALAELPARSLTLKVCDCPAPSLAKENEPLAG